MAEKVSGPMADIADFWATKANPHSSVVISNMSVASGRGMDRIRQHWTRPMLARLRLV